MVYSKQAPLGACETKELLDNPASGDISIPPPPTSAPRTEAQIASARACFNECRKMLGKPEKPYPFLPPNTPA